MLQKALDEKNEKRLGIWHGHASFGPFHSGKDRNNLSLYYQKFTTKNIYVLGHTSDKLVPGNVLQSFDKDAALLSLKTSGLIPSEILAAATEENLTQVLALLKTVEIKKPYGPAFFYSVVFDKGSIGCVKDGRIDLARWQHNSRHRPIYDARLLMQDMESGKVEDFTGLDKEVGVEIIKGEAKLDLSTEFLLENILENVIYEGRQLKAHRDIIYKKLRIGTKEESSKIKQSIEASARKTVMDFSISPEATAASKTTKIGSLDAVVETEGQKTGVGQDDVVKEIEQNSLRPQTPAYLAAFDRIRSKNDDSASHEVFGNIFRNDYTVADYKKAFEVKRDIEKGNEDSEIAKHFLNSFDTHVSRQAGEMMEYINFANGFLRKVFYKDNKNDYLVESVEEIQQLIGRIKPRVKIIKGNVINLEGNINPQVYEKLEDSVSQFYKTLEENAGNQSRLISEIIQSGSKRQQERISSIKEAWTNGQIR
jgi:hypothetical protein